MHIFVEKIVGETVEIVNEDFFHLARVLRCRKGDSLTIVSLSDSFYVQATVASINKHNIIATINSKIEKPPKKYPQIILYQAIAKKAKMDVILQKAVELGVSKIVPLITKNVVPENPNVERWRTIVKEASMQSRRVDIPVVEQPITLSEMLKQKPATCMCLVESGEQRLDFRDYLEGLDKSVQQLGVVIGAEGGFTQPEKLLFLENNVAAISFGENILRTETAAIAALSVLKWFYKI